MSRAFSLACERCGEDVPRKRHPQEDERVVHNAKHKNSKGENCKRLWEKEKERQAHEREKLIAGLGDGPLLEEEVGRLAWEAEVAGRVEAIRKTGEPNVELVGGGSGSSDPYLRDPVLSPPNYGLCDCDGGAYGDPDNRPICFSCGRVRPNAGKWRVNGFDHIDALMRQPWGSKHRKRGRAA